MMTNMSLLANLSLVVALCCGIVFPGQSAQNKQSVDKHSTNMKGANAKSVKEKRVSDKKSVNTKSLNDKGVNAKKSENDKTEPEKQAAKAGLTAAVVKDQLTQTEKAVANGLGRAHNSVTLAFESIRFGKPRKTTKKDREVNSIHGPMIYPVRVKYTAHKQWANGDTKVEKVHENFYFYKDRYGYWQYTF